MQHFKYMTFDDAPYAFHKTVKAYIEGGTYKDAAKLIGRSHWTVQCYIAHLRVMCNTSSAIVACEKYTAWRFERKEKLRREEIDRLKAEREKLMRKIEELRALLETAKLQRAAA